MLAVRRVALRFATLRPTAAAVSGLRATAIRSHNAEVSVHHQTGSSSGRRCFAQMAAPGSGTSTSGAPSPPALPQFETLKLTYLDPECHILEIALNRPAVSNAMNRVMWSELPRAVAAAETDGTSRVLLLSGSPTTTSTTTSSGSSGSKNFCAGLDLLDHADMLGGGDSAAAPDAARRAFNLHRFIRSYQASLDAFATGTNKPVIAAVHGACIGGGVDLVAACDIRLTTADAVWCIKEAELGLAADVGTLQRLPRQTGNSSLLRELVFTARRFSGEEAAAAGIVSAVLPDAAALRAHALALARRIAVHSPVAVQGSKYLLNQGEGRPVADGLAMAAVWNAAMLQTGDLGVAAEAGMTKQQPRFPKL